MQHSGRPFGIRSGRLSTARVVIGAALAVGLVGCTDRPAQQIGPSTEGVELQDVSGLRQWRVPLDSPLVALGSSDDPEVDVGDWRESVGVLDDGRILVTGSVDWPVRVFSPDGKPLSRIRKGSGPEEFQPTATFLLTRDSVVIGDFLNGPVKVLNRSFQVIRQVPFQPSRYRVDLLGKEPGGTWLAVRVVSDPSPDSAEWVRLSPDFRVATILARFPGPVPVLTDRGRSVIQRFAYASDGVRIYWIRNEKPTIEVLDDTGRRVRTIGLAVQGQKDVGRVGLVRYFAGITVGSDGTAWVKLARSERPDSDTYVVIDTTGRGRALVFLPKRVGVVQLLRDKVLLKGRDSYDGFRFTVVPVRYD